MLPNAFIHSIVIATLANCSGQIRGLKRPEQDSQDVWQSTLLTNVSVPLSRIGEDQDGNVYVTRHQDGAIYMLTER